MAPLFFPRCVSTSLSVPNTQVRKIRRPPSIRRACDGELSKFVRPQTGETTPKPPGLATQCSECLDLSNWGALSSAVPSTPRKSNAMAFRQHLQKPSLCQQRLQRKVCGSMTNPWQVTHDVAPAKHYSAGVNPRCCQLSSVIFKLPALTHVGATIICGTAINPDDAVPRFIGLVEERF